VHWDLLKRDPASVGVVARKVLLPRDYVLDVWDISNHSSRADIQVAVIQHQFLSLDIALELWSQLYESEKEILIKGGVFKFVTKEQLPVLLADESAVVQALASDLLVQAESRYIDSTLYASARPARL